MEVQEEMLVIFKGQEYGKLSLVLKGAGGQSRLKRVAEMKNNKEEA